MSLPWSTCTSKARSFSLSCIPKPHAPFPHRRLAFCFIFLAGVAGAYEYRPPSRHFRVTTTILIFFSSLLPRALSFFVAAPFLMPIATSPSALPRPATFVKMEDRKRPASGAVDDCAPPTKRQAVNGSSKSKDDSGDMKEEAWIEVSCVTRQSLRHHPPPSSTRVGCLPPPYRCPGPSPAATAGIKTR